MMIKFVILGGSSPFTAELIDRLTDLALQGRLDPIHLVLHGRNLKLLESLKGYGKKQLNQLGWKIDTATEMSSALEGADVVLHQIRYGGLDGRKDDEQLAQQFDFPADETLGPSGLQAAIRTSHLIRKSAENMLASCPDALILNLTNPLSISVSLLQDFGLKKTIGLCELPMVTAKNAARLLSLPEDGIEWSYIGLNHRGFIYNLKHEGRPMLSEFLGKIKNEPFEGIKYEVISNLQAIPLKYFRLFFETNHNLGSRALQLEKLRSLLASELASPTNKIHTLLKKRYMAWYADAVVPFLEAYQRNLGRVMVVNYSDNEGLTVESKVCVFKDRLEPVKDSGLMPATDVNVWIKQFKFHEMACLKASRNFDREYIRNALANDLLLNSSHNVEKIAQAIFAYCAKIKSCGADR